MSTTETTGIEAQAPIGDGSIWGAPPPVSASAAVPGPTAPGVEPGVEPGVQPGVQPGAARTGRRRLPEMVRTKVAAVLAAAGLVVGGAAGVAIGHGSGSTTQTPAGVTGQGGPGGGFGQGGPGGFGQQGQSGTTQQGQGTQPGTLPDGTAQDGTTT